MAERRFHVILNANSGTAHALGITAESLRAMFTVRGLTAEVDADTNTPFSRRIEKALAGPADVLVAAGGDGTITALTGAILDTGKSLGIIPLGTVNALAKDLQIPLDPEHAVDMLRDGAPQRIDVGKVNGRVFLHKVVIGFIPGVAAGREKIRGRQDWGAKWGFLRYFFRRLARARRIALVIETDTGETRVERVQAVAVASNAYDEGFGRFFSRAHLDRGELTLYVLKHFTFADFVRLTSGMFLGRWREDEALRIDVVQSVTITGRKRQLKVMLDGEVETLNTPLQFSIAPLALPILAPPQEEQTPAEVVLGVVGGET